MTTPKTDAAYWDKNWYSRDTIPAPVISANATYLEGKIHELFARVLTPRRGQALLEIGCGGSRWLPYFAIEHGLRVSGVDYAPLGCALARKVLDAAGVAGDVMQLDALAANAALQGRFDIVFSFGVVEHFSNTSACVAAFGRYLKPGGVIITTVPNMTGALGFLQRVLNRPVYDNHVPLTREELAAAHRSAGLHLEEFGYLGVCDFHVVNLSDVPVHGVRGRAVHGVALAAYRFSRMVWALDRIRPFQLRRFLAPMVYCVATRRD